MAKKLFLGISLDKMQRQHIEQLQSRLRTDMRVIPLPNLHITVAFFGIVPHKMQRKLEKRISALHKTKFTITMDKITYWKKTKILCLTGQKQDKSLLQLAKECRLLADALNLHSSEHIFTAHLTLARKARQLPKTLDKLSFKPVVIQPDAVHLFESKSSNKGVIYQRLRSWQLH